MLLLSIAAFPATQGAEIPDTLLNTFVAAYGDPPPPAMQGSAVAIAGDRVATGSPGNTFGSPNVGTVYVFDRTNNGLLWELHNPRSANESGFGSVLAMSGNLLVVGSPKDDEDEFGSGVVYVYDLARATPQQPAHTLPNPEPGVLDQFGAAVGIDGTRVVVGAPWDDTDANESGSVYYFDLSGPNPTVPVLRLGRPQKTPACTGCLFGTAVGISGPRVVVGAVGDDIGATDAGAAYVFDLAGSTPLVPVAEIRNPVPFTADFFGRPVAIEDDWVVVAAPADRNVIGTVYAYQLGGTSPLIPRNTLSNPTPAAGDFFGQAIALSGSLLVVGAPEDDASVLVRNTGKAYLYDLAGGTPETVLATLADPRPAADDRFGAAAAIDSNRIVIGAPADNLFNADTGVSFLFGAAPVLSFSWGTEGELMISWPPGYPEFILYSYAQLSAPRWEEVPGGERSPVRIPLLEAEQYFRLLKPD